jgi:hypothetical protein
MRSLYDVHKELTDVCVYAELLARSVNKAISWMPVMIDDLH